jgi:hypothetical protein
MGRLLSLNRLRVFEKGVHIKQANQHTKQSSSIRRTSCSISRERVYIICLVVLCIYKRAWPDEGADDDDDGAAFGFTHDDMF